MSIDERALSQALHDAVRDPVVPPSLATRVAARHRRRRRVLASGTVGVTAAAVLATVVVANAVRRPVDETTPASPGPVVGTVGVVVARPGQAPLFCASVMRHVPMNPPPPSCQPPWVRVEGVDLDRLAGRAEKDGTVWGGARLVGEYREGTLYVTRQDAVQRIRPLMGRRYPIPCAAPSGGWPVNGTSESQPGFDELKEWTSRHRDEVVMKAYAQADDGRWVFVVTAVHPEVVEKAFPDERSLCVVRSRYTPAQIAAAEADVRAYRERELGIAGEATDSREGAQVHVALSVRLRDAEVDALVARHPAGLVEVEEFLLPVTD